ncbi:hypothetical protein C8D87_11418 [Lentzea atacamensis]|uniref:Uncharacterized protein n=2 Tax=Lentzea atacamensis TaxID=531938 RepID=A0ABX9DZ65_9PSEU|nr:hypothetical protein C8D87_11418 [Lentzea atacamensis]
MSNSHSKRNAVDAVRATTGAGHTEARRAASAARQRPMSDVDPIAVPAPVAVSVAQHLRAAGFHIAAVHQLGRDNGVLPQFRSDMVTGPAAQFGTALSQVSSRLTDLSTWSERTAHRSGAITCVPEHLSRSADSEAALRILYPELPDDAGGDRWCAKAGGRMPLPGEGHVEPSSDTVPWSARSLLPGAAPEWTLSAHGSGINVRSAGDVVPGTPSAAIWDANEHVHRYLSSWMSRAGDSPADLAAALDGLVALASALPKAIEMVSREIARRSKEGLLEGVDRQRLAQSAAKLTAMTAETAEDRVGQINHLRGAVHGIRRAVTGATAVLPPAPGMRAKLERIAPRFTGRSAAQLRTELGEEAFLQRQISRARPGDYSRHDLLERMLTWMHATGATEYDAAAHLAAENKAVTA